MNLRNLRRAAGTARVSRRRLTVVGLCATLGVSAVAVPAASASASARSDSSVAASATASYAGVLTVTVNNVYYRASPGGTRLGQVHAGQKANVICSHLHTDGWSWYKVDLWGGASNVWIRNADYIQYEGIQEPFC